jgi:hypothetical protein
VLESERRDLGKVCALGLLSSSPHPLNRGLHVYGVPENDSVGEQAQGVRAIDELFDVA